MDSILSEEYAKVGTLLAEKLGVTRDAVRARARKLGLKGPDKKVWMRRFIYKKDTSDGE